MRAILTAVPGPEKYHIGGMSVSHRDPLELSRAPSVAIREGLNTGCPGQVIRRSSSTQIATGRASTGLTTGACPDYRKDHIKALTFGGADAVWNLQWQTIASGLPPSSPPFYR
jgi:hypothetical protein